MRVAALAIGVVAASAVTCTPPFTNLYGQCVMLAEWKAQCGVDQSKCNAFFSGKPQCDANNPSNCGWTYSAAVQFCRQYGKGYSLVKVSNQYQVRRAAC